MIHSSAVIDNGAKIGKDVKIGPFCVVGPNVILEDGVDLVAHVYVAGDTRIGKGTKIFPHATIGCDPQSWGYKGEKSQIIIGENNLIREYVTVHPGTEKGGMITKIGDGCMLMIGTHIAHDCQIGNHVVMANNCMLSGHVSIGDHVNMGGGSGIHQFVRIGRGAMIGGMSGVSNDVIPYGFVVGNRGNLVGLNLVGLKRRNISRNEIHALRNAYRLLFANEGTLAERMEDVAKMFTDNAIIDEVIDFMRANSDRNICVPAQSTMASEV